MTRKSLLIAAAAIGVAVAALILILGANAKNDDEGSASGSANANTSPTATPVVETPTATPVATQPAPAPTSTTQPPPPAPTSTSVPAPLPPAPPAPGPPPPAPPVPPEATPVVPAGREVRAAPIDGLDVRVQESFPQQYVAQVKAGLPGGCAQRHASTVSRNGNVFQINVTNTLPTGNVACTMIYGSYDLNVPLPGPFVSGQTYTVQVNDKQTTFRAQ